jgi:sortase (surface protein transpeptidase)
MALAIVGTLLSGCSGAGLSRQESRGRAHAAPERRTEVEARPAVTRALMRFRSIRSYVTVDKPRRITIPEIGVNSPLEPLGRNADGTIEVPDEWQVAGWFSGGPVPGEPGPAVILGHVDSRTGPAVFYRLRELGPGDGVFVRQTNGRRAKFVVDSIEQYDKNEFPTSAVYFPTLEPVLRLITCGGDFDASLGHYRDNVIVYASLSP